MPNQNPNVVDKYHDLVASRLKAWSSHVETSRKIYDQVLGNAGSKDYSFRHMAGDVTNLWLACYDTAFGWLLPQAPSSTTTAAAPTAKPAASASRRKPKPKA